MPLATALAFTKIQRSRVAMMGLDNRFALLREPP
jgi:hypothetical protein